MLCVLVVTGVALAHAQNYERMSDVESDLFAENAFVNGDYQTMKNVRRYWVQEAQRMRSMKNMEFCLTGNSEGILKVTVPARVLFASNDSILLASADSYLRQFLHLVKGSEAVASVIVVGYSDNNGSERYLRTLSGGRARQIHRWLARQGVGPAVIRSYGLGNKVPRNANANMAQREKNRRVSFYFVPNRRMLKNAKRGILK